MARLSPQVLVQLARRTVQQELKWKPTAEHAPPIPDGAVTDDPMAELAPLDVRLLQQLGFRAYLDPTTGESAWPVPLGMTPHELYLFGKEHGVLYESPVSGDILLQRAIWGKEYAHAGLVMTVNGTGSLFNHQVDYEISRPLKGTRPPWIPRARLHVQAEPAHEPGAGRPVPAVGGTARA